MVWQILALGGAACESAFQIAVKKTSTSASKSMSANVFTTAGLFLLAGAMLTGLPEIKQGFWQYAVLNGFLLAIGFYFYFKAIESEEVSLVTPLLAFTPVITLFLTPLVTEETVSPGGIAGVLLIVLGAFFLQTTGGIRWSRGTKYMLAAALMLGVTANFVKLAINESNVFFTGGVINLIAGILLGINAHIEEKKIRQITKSELAIAGFWALGDLLMLTAFTYAPAAYAVAIKRTSALFTIVIAGTWLKEENTAKRLGAAAIMIAGTFLLALYS